MSEAQVLMTVSDLLSFYSRNNYLEKSFAFQWERGSFWGGTSFLNGESAP